MKYELRTAQLIFMEGSRWVELVDCSPRPEDLVPDPPKERIPHDELYAKQKATWDWWHGY